MEGTRELKLHVYSKSRLNFDEHCAQGKVEVSRAHACLLFACEHTAARTVVIMPMQLVNGYGNYLCIIFSC